jgi:hypothetical protein
MGRGDNAFMKQLNIYESGNAQFLIVPVGKNLRLRSF